MPTERDPAASMALLRELVQQDAALEYAEAARRHRGTPPGRTTRTWFALTCAVIAGLLALSVVQRQATAPAAEKARQVLVERVAQTQADIEALETEVASTRADLAAAEEVLLTQSDEGSALATRISTLEEGTGYSAVTGPGLVVVLAAAPGSDPAVADDPGRVLDQDVQNAVNGLWAVGAEAIAVNGIRLTATTAIRSAGAAILVDFRPLLPPYRVESIGDGAAMATAFPLTSSGRALKGVSDQFGVQVAVDEASALTLPASSALLPVRARVPGDPTVTVDPSPSAVTTGKEGQP